MTQIGILTGLTAEARLLSDTLLAHRPAPLVARTAANAARARHEADRLIASGAIALISFGVAGGLDPRLQAGDLVFADRVIMPDGRAIPTDEIWLNAALRRAGLAKVTIGPVIGAERLIATADEKIIARASGAVAGDLESGATAAAAAEAGIPFLVVRAISDDASRSLPSVARVPLKPCGSIKLDQVARALCIYPGEWPAVARLAFDTRAALVALRGVARSGALLPP